MIGDFEQRYGAYLHERDEARRAEVARILATMTKRERAPIKEVAVMASVRGRMHAGRREETPPDSEIVFDTILACLYMPDLYPTIARLRRIADRRAKKLETGP